MPKVLVVYGSKMGGTAGIAGMIGEVLEASGLDVTITRAGDLRSVHGYDAVIVGGGLYTGRWRPEARRFVKRFARALESLPIWFFSSGPLDDSAVTSDIPPTRQVSHLMDLVGARGHVTFGGRLPENATGFVARKMAEDHAGDWRDPDRIRGWAGEVAEELHKRRAA